MYNYTILIGISIIASLSFVFLAVYLFFSRKKGKLVEKIRKAETERFDALSTTMQLTNTAFKQEKNFQTATTVFEYYESLTSVHEIMFSANNTALKPVVDFDARVLEGQYTILGELKGGGMGRIFLVRKDNVGNDWILKYVPANIGELTNEADILKELANPALPKIIDIFENETGMYIVESYIEGASMQATLKALKSIPEFQLLDWAMQMAQVLSYLHNREQPIYHFDLKPANIMVTHGNHLVLIDFGISKRKSETSESNAVTYTYAAPEQLKKTYKNKRHNEIIEARFGELPKERVNWDLDERTDIYSLGVVLFEIATGEIPTIYNRDTLNDRLTDSMCAIINKCLEIDPKNRYQSANELITALLHQKKEVVIDIDRTIIKRKLAKVAMFVLVPLAAFSLSSGLLVRDVAAAAQIYINPEIVTVSVMSSSEVQITQILPEIDNPLVRIFVGDDGQQTINPNQLSWDIAASGIAQLDGNRIIGLAEGETMVHGRYRSQDISMFVNVVEPMHGMIDISMRYRIGNIVRLFAGTNHRERIDGSLEQAEFVSPESMAVANDGSIYFTDSGWLRRIKDGSIETIDIGAYHLRVELVRTYKDYVYILTHEWQEDNGYFYGIMQITENGAKMQYIGDAQFTKIRDFVIDDDYLFFIERNDGVGATYLRRLNRHDFSDIYTLTELTEGTAAMDIDNGRIYLADADEATLVFYEDNQFIPLAGVSSELAFIDGSAPLFYRPTRIRYNNGALYIWDFNVLRKVYLENDIAKDAISIAGVASPEYDTVFLEQEQAEKIVFPYSLSADFIHLDGGILLSDPRRGIIWLIEQDV